MYLVSNFYWPNGSSPSWNTSVFFFSNFFRLQGQRRRRQVERKRDRQVFHPHIHNHEQLFIHRHQSCQSATGFFCTEKPVHLDTSVTFPTLPSWSSFNISKWYYSILASVVCYFAHMLLILRRDFSILNCSGWALSLNDRPPSITVTDGEPALA